MIFVHLDLKLFWGFTSMSAVLLVTNYQMKDFYDLFICFFIRRSNRDGFMVWASLDARWSLLIAILFCYYGSWIPKCLIFCAN